MLPRQPKSGTCGDTVPEHVPPLPGLHAEPALRPSGYGLSSSSPQPVPVHSRLWPRTFVLVHFASLLQNWPPPSPLRCTAVPMPKTVVRLPYGSVSVTESRSAPVILTRPVPSGFGPVPSPRSKW
ncbi:hypothetical protein GCM10023321_81220 [Pseudonocardia eucalypti]|uniref:Uncharacterized protein n=1 Tax=Pseudonocardia eucalypti TaxID=648755 RepID=A0ABP9REP2_9PSEU